MAFKLNELKKVLLFEPWNLGDLIISAYFARELKKQSDLQIDFICKQQWKDWLSSQSFVSNVIPFYAPWTDKKNKYLFSKYDYRKISELKKEIRQGYYDLVWDVRGDIRHKFFLAFMANTKVVSANYNSECNVYERVNAFLDLFVDGEAITHKKYSIKKTQKIFLFFDSYWVNKRVSERVGCLLIEELISNGFEVFLVEPPETSYSEYKSRFGESIKICSGSILDISNILMKVDLCISTDSAWLHMAYFLGIPAIGLFGSLNAKQWAPPGTSVVFSDNPLSFKDRYKLKNELVQPLDKLDINKILAIVRY